MESQFKVELKRQGLVVRGLTNVNYEGELIIPPKVEYQGKKYPVTEIGTEAFKDCTGLTRVVIPDTVTQIWIGAFKRCTNLTSVVMGNSVKHNMNYQMASKTATGTKKQHDLYEESNGDWYMSLETDNCVVLAVADGLGKCANDSRASHTACDTFIEKCALALNHNEMLDEAAIRRFCVEIDPELAGHNDMTCFSAVVWYTNTDQVVWFNVGDTRIYKCSRSGIMTQMTVDDRAVDNQRSDDPRFGKFRTEHGALIPSVGVNLALGDGNHEKFHTGSFEFKPGESLILCSDGMYKSSSFDKDMADLLGSVFMDEAIKRIETTDGDDNTLLVLRRDMTVNNGLDELMTQFEQAPNAIPRHVLIDSFCDGLEKMLQNNADASAIAKVAAFMKLHVIYPDKQRIDKLFNAVFNRLKATQQGTEWQQLNAACLDLKDILKYVFTH